MIITDKDRLRTECKDVSLFQAQNIILQLEAELNKAGNGIGLAAPQIDINAKVCILKINKLVSLVNPVIVESFDLMEFHHEGCLSFPGQFVNTKRFNEVMVKDDIHPNGVVFTGLEAIVAQHEIGHLYGELMFDYEIKIPLRNEKCWCGSDRKYKRCHSGKEIKNG